MLTGYFSEAERGVIESSNVAWCVVVMAVVSDGMTIKWVVKTFQCAHHPQVEYFRIEDIQQQQKKSVKMS